MAVADEDGVEVAGRRGARVRLGCLLALLVLAAGLRLADDAGLTAFLAPAPFTGRRELVSGGVVEQIDLRDPPARLVVAKIPRGKGLGLRAALLDPSAQRLARLGTAAESLGALAAINGDYHRLGGHCYASPYSTLIAGGVPQAIGSPFSYACSFWLDPQGAPRLGRLELELRLRFPEGGEQRAWLNLEDGPLSLISRPPSGSWSASGFVGVPVEVPASLRSGELIVRGSAGGTWEGPALLAQGPAAPLLARLKEGDRIQCELRGAQLGAPLAIGTGPRLLEQGEVHADARLSSAGWVARVARTGLGYDDEALYLVTTLDVPRAGLDMETFARALKALGCQEALNLDGGPSTFLWASGPTNRPAETDDPVACGLFVLPSGEGTELR